MKPTSRNSGDQAGVALASAHVAVPAMMAVMKYRVESPKRSSIRLCSDHPAGRVISSKGRRDRLSLRSMNDFIQMRSAMAGIPGTMTRYNRDGNTRFFLTRPGCGAIRKARTTRLRMGCDRVCVWSGILRHSWVRHACKAAAEPMQKGRRGGEHRTSNTKH